MNVVKPCLHSLSGPNMLLVMSVSLPFEGNESGTIAILAQGTHWAVSAKQAFVQHWPRFDSSRVHVCVMMWQIRLFPQCFAT